MTDRVSVMVRVDVAAPPEAVWPRLTDHEGMVSWWPLRAVTLARAGRSDPNGMGAIREMRGPAMRLREEVVAWDPPHGYEYQLRDGAPIRDHHGWVELRAHDGGTEICWRIEFRPLIPGTGGLIRAVLQRVLGDALQRLKGQIETALPR